MSSLPQRISITALVAEAVLGGARLAYACELLGFSERTLQRWQLTADEDPDRRTLRHEAPAQVGDILGRRAVAEHRLHGIAGHEMDQGEDERGHAEQHRHGEQQAPDEEPRHAEIPRRVISFVNPCRVTPNSAAARPR